MRCIRSQADSLIAGLPKKEMTAMALGLAHRYLQFLKFFILLYFSFNLNNKTKFVLVTVCLDIN